MNIPILDFALVAVGTLLQLVVFILLIRKRLFSSLPIFVAYNGYTLATCLLGLALVRLGAEAHDWLWMVHSVFETSLYLLVLLELGKTVLRFNNIRAGSRLLVIFLFLINIVILWPAVQWQISLDSYPFFWRLTLRMLQVTTVIQTAAFGSLVGWSSLNRLRWPKPEFRIATGMGVWTAVSLAALMLHNDGFNGAKYHWVDLLTPATTLFVMAWWVQTFWVLPPRIRYPQESPVFELAGGGSDN